MIGFDRTILIKLVTMTMPFGKYEGRVLCDLPPAYLNWFKQKGFPKGKLGVYMETLYEIKLNGLDYLLVPIRDMMGKQETPAYLRLGEEQLKKQFGGKTTEEIFEYIHEQNFWGASESASGPGSEHDQTARIRTLLPELFARYEITTILDLPCGDFQWMQNLDLSNKMYTGGDIVTSIVEQNKKQYETKNIRFVKMNLLMDQLPKVDLVLCRDCLVHFSLEDIEEAIDHLKRSQSTYLLTTHFENHPANEDILTGDWRPINLCESPFHFPEPLEIINENCTELGGLYHDKCLALWRIDAIASH